MGLQVSASNSDLLLNCSRPFDPEVELDEREPTDAMRYGSASAEVMAWLRKSPEKTAVSSSIIAAKSAEDWKLSEDDSKTLILHTRRAFLYWKAWADGDNPLKKKLSVVRVETPLATYLGHETDKKRTVSTRETKLDLESHTYDLDENEIGGTPDVCLKNASKEIRVVCDDKSGEDRAMVFNSPSSMGQLKTLALMTDATHVAIFHSPRSGGSDAIYLDPISPKELADHHQALRKAMSRIGDGSMRPGPWCKHCPARGSCPTQYGELAVHTGALVKKLTGTGAVQLSDGTDRGLFVQTWRQMEKLAKLARDQIKEEVREGAVYETPSGKVLTLVPAGRENLSKTSVLEAYGKKAGEEKLEELRKAGALKRIEWEELREV